MDKMLRTNSYGVLKTTCSIQKKLLQEKDLTFQRALSIAQESEAADRNLREMKAPKRSWTSTGRE